MKKSYKKPGTRVDKSKLGDPTKKALASLLTPSLNNLPNMWKEVEQQIRTRYRVDLTMTYHNIIMGFRQDTYSNYAAINTIIMAVKKRICYKERIFSVLF